MNLIFKLYSLIDFLKFFKILNLMNYNADKLNL